MYINILTHPTLFYLISANLPQLVGRYMSEVL